MNLEHNNTGSASETSAPEQSATQSAPAAPSPQPQPGSGGQPGKKPVVIYIMILFIVAFLLMALSFVMHQRSNSEVLGQLETLMQKENIPRGQSALLKGKAKP